MKKTCLALAIAILPLTAVFAKEFPSAKEFEAEKGTKETNKRHWVAADRNSKNAVWNEACLFNFSYEIGYNEYKTLDQREDFYEWAADTLRKMGHEIKWIEMALTITDLIEPATAGKTKISQYAIAGNKVVFDSAFVRLQQVFRMEKPLKNEEAKAWDDNMIQFEQEVLLQPFFDKVDIVTLEKMAKMAKGEGIYMFYTTKSLRFKGDLRNIKHRVDYAHNQVLPFVNKKINADLRKRFSDNNIKAEDAKSMKAAEKYLERLEREENPNAGEKPVKAPKAKKKPAAEVKSE